GRRTRRPAGRAVARVVLGVDVGTTSAKAVAFDERGRDLGSGEQTYPLLEPAPGQSVQEPDAVLAGMVAAIRSAAATARERGPEVSALSVSAAMHAIAALDASNRPLTPMVTWADLRAADQAERLR